MRISAAVTCRRPRPRVIPVQSATTDSSSSAVSSLGPNTKQYIPHCTILHRCGDDAGCCNSDTRTCVARSQQLVDLYFFVSTVRGTARPAGD